ncbi:MAG: leader peptidase (prepilin peptidase) / N-methyltransferase [Pseudonocardiales bacterium]|jgi:leader peptidase (prepilin peptidase)/N-methyltransferase|nr:leader peptidase (prepilin peptidase) / N-methyltransferase [Pseudonocardiales bacterium]MDQ1751656.1 leader peptidase (prepilin peptidase) / N-methyltransferase [Pseudonocardiales bacterium]
MLSLILAVTVLGAVSTRFVDRLVVRPLPSDSPGQPFLADRPRTRLALVSICLISLFIAVGIRLGSLHSLAALPAYLYFVAIGVALSFIDIASHRLPNAIVLPSYPVLAVLLTAATIWHHDWSALLRAAIGGAILFLFYLVLALVHPAGMGLGDVKLSALLGALLAYISWSALIVGALAGFMLAALVGIAMIASRRGGLKTAIPFGPFMIVGTMLGILVGAQIAHGYLSGLGNT